MIVDLPPSIIQLERPAIIRPFAAVCPFLPYLPRKVLTETLFDRTTGTNIGDMINNGGIAAAFDGTTSQATTSCATKNNAGTAGGYTGKNLGAAYPISKIIVTSPNNAGTTQSGTGELRLYAKATAPSSVTDGTQLGTTGVIATASSTQYTVNSSDTATAYQYVWCADFSNTVGNDVYFAELAIYVMQ